MSSYACARAGGVSPAGGRAAGEGGAQPHHDQAVVPDLLHRVVRPLGLGGLVVVLDGDPLAHEVEADGLLLLARQRLRLVLPLHAVPAEHVLQPLRVGLGELLLALAVEEYLFFHEWAGFV